MSLTITATPHVAHIPAPVVRPSTATAAPAPATSTPPSSAQETAELNQLLNKYRTDLSQGQAASTLSGLSRQIMAAAKDAGQHVSLPRAPANAGAAAAPPASAPEAGKINVTA
jgi:hypothetical protein